MATKKKATATKKKATTAKKTTTAAKKATKTTKTTKAAAKPLPAIGPVKQTLTKSALLNLMSERHQLSRKQANEVLGTIESVIMGSVHPKGAGEFTLPGVMKVTLRKVPARKAGTLIRNPATGEMIKAAAKPATVRVKIRPLSKLKKAATN